MWQVKDKGFLPDCTPVKRLPIKDYNNTQFVVTLENLASNLPNFISARCIREELVVGLRQLAPVYNKPDLIDSIGEEKDIERLYMLFCMFATAYVHADGEITANRVPKEISVPLARAAHLARRHPMLNYHSYILCNWSIHNNKIEPLVTFTNEPEETAYIAALVKLETETKFDTLDWAHDWLLKYVEVKKEFSSRYFYPFQGIMFEGWQHKPLDYLCYMNSPTFSYIERLLGLNPDNFDKHRPVQHNEFLNSVKPLTKIDQDFKRFFMNMFAR